MYRGGRGMDFHSLGRFLFLLGVAFSTVETEGWQQGDSQTKDDGPWNQNRNSWGPDDSQVKDSGKWNPRDKDQSSGWTPGDAQTKENGRWNNDQNRRMMWDSQMKVDGMWDNKKNWGPHDAQEKDDRARPNEGSKPSEGNWNPNDAQVKDQGRWNSEGSQRNPDTFGPGDSQMKDSGRWMPEGSFDSSDSQRKGSGDWNKPSEGNWGPMDSQVKNPADWDGKMGSGENWGPSDGQVKTDGEWGPGGNVSPPGGMVWNPDQNVQPENGGITGPWEGNQGQGWTGDSPGPGSGGDSLEPAVIPDHGGGGMYEEAGNVGGQGDLGGPGDGSLVGGSPDAIGQVGGDGTGDRALGDMGDTADLFPPRQPQGNYKGGDTSAHPGDDPSQWRLEDSIPGTPGVDYPNYSTIPATSFDCKQHENPGYYGDVEAQCQVFHICQSDGRHDAFLCPLGTIFNQQYFVCVWWFNYKCEDTAMFYNLNADLYKGGHDAQGNFKGGPAPGGTGPADGGSDAERSDYDKSLTGGREDSIIPPGVGVQSPGSSGESGLDSPAGQGGNWDANRRQMNGGQDGYPQVTPDAPSGRPQGSYDGPMMDAKELGVPGGQDGYGQDDGKRNRGMGQRDWNSGVKGGAAGGNGNGRWDSQDKAVMDGGYGKKGGNWAPGNGGGVKGRKARSWDNGEKWELDSEIPLDREGSSWIPLDDEPPVLLNTSPRSGTYELVKRDGTWESDSKDQHEESQDLRTSHESDWKRGSREGAQEPQRFDWHNRNEVSSPSRWSNSREDYQNLNHKRGRANRSWNQLGKSFKEPQKEDRMVQNNKNWWLEALKGSTDDSKERWNENDNKQNRRYKNVQEVKDTPHIYGSRSTLNGYFDYSKEQDSSDSETRNWT